MRSYWLQTNTFGRKQNKYKNLSKLTYLQLLQLGKLLCNLREQRSLNTFLSLFLLLRVKLESQCLSLKLVPARTKSVLKLLQADRTGSSI